MNENQLIHEGAKIAREAEHPATLDEARKALSADLKSMSPGNYAEVLRQAVATNNADIKSNPSLPDIVFATSSHSLMPDELFTRTPTQSDMANRIFYPQYEDHRGARGHVAIAPTEQAQKNDSAGVQKHSDYPTGHPTTPTRPSSAPPETKHWYDPIVGGGIGAIMPSPLHGPINALMPQERRPPSTGNASLPPKH